MNKLKVWYNERGRLVTDEDEWRAFITQPREGIVNNNWSNVDDAAVPASIMEVAATCPYQGRNRRWEVNEEGTYRIVLYGDDPTNTLATFYPLQPVIL